jgi:hypothetical protein
MIKVIRSRNRRQAGHEACMVEMRNAHKMSVVIPEVKVTFGRLKHKWVDDVKMGLE